MDANVSLTASQFLGDGSTGWAGATGEIETITFHLSGSGTAKIYIGCRDNNDGWGNWDSTCADTFWVQYTQKESDTVSINGEDDYLFTFSTPVPIETGRFYRIDVQLISGTGNAYFYSGTGQIANSYCKRSGWNYCGDVDGSDLYMIINQVQAVANPNWDGAYPYFLFKDTYICSTGHWCKFHYQYDTDTFNSPYDYLEIQKLDTYTAISGVSIATSTIFEENVYPSKIAGSSWFRLAGPMATSTYGNYQAIGHIAEYYDTELELTIAATTTPAYKFLIFSPDGPGDIWWDTGKATSSGRILWGGMTAHDMACSPERWASSTANVYFDYCSAFETIIEASYRVVEFMESAVEYTGVRFSSTFPFVLPKQFYKSWVASEALDMPVDLEFIDIVQDGNLYINIPPQWTGDATTTVAVFGTAIWTTTSASATFFAGIRSLSTYMLWFLFILTLWDLGRRVISDLKSYD